ncbi:MAG: AEC family transporter, partial [Clostridia bacterium]|nr:AEC family transporter [Clostridia bacterium]
MDNLIFSLNATLPVFFTMVLGMVFRRVNLLDDHTVSKLNKFVFNAALPVLLFQDISGANFYEVWNTKFVLFCLAATVLSICIAVGLSYLMKDKTKQGEFIQSSYRSSAAILGIAFIQNIYGNSGMAPLMIIGSVPLYNAMAVVVLS